MKFSDSKEAKDALELVTSLQARFVKQLDSLCKEFGEDKAFEEVTWLRDNGYHGGGSRFESRDKKLFNTASVNVSQVHYDDMPEKNLQSATAISTIIHPLNPLVSSIHIHISFTQLRNGNSYWRIMADLNPGIFYAEDKNSFENTLRELSGNNFDEGSQQGDKYFFIPALQRHRGVSHFYLENYFTDDKVSDFNYAKSFGEGIIDEYINITRNALHSRSSYTDDDLAKQQDYHTVYLFQVLTLDRGTTSGLLIHDQNDVGIMGSLPLHVNTRLLYSFKDKVVPPQDELVEDIVNAIGVDGLVDEDVKKKLAEAVRVHYIKYPEALNMQASGNIIPSTVNNHTD